METLSQAVHFGYLAAMQLSLTAEERTDITSSDLYDLALGAMRLNGGDRKTLSPGKNVVVNNDIHYYGQWVQTGYYGIVVDGVANRVSHNAIHHAPFDGKKGLCCLQLANKDLVFLSAHLTDAVAVLFTEDVACKYLVGVVVEAV